MMHPARRFTVAVAADAEDLASRLTERSWTLCTGFRLGDLLFLNDATSEDGAPEWAVFSLQAQYGAPGFRSTAVQIETITFGWMTPASAMRQIRRLQSGELCSPMGRYTLKLDHPAGACLHCA